jgi:NAD(P)-dependent dehydrogenase (short-subunit alcohol dehydrogenase family)
MASKRALVAGGAGNVGFFLVQGLLEAGATVVVPSRSEKRLERLRSRLAATEGSPDDGARLITLSGDTGSEAGMSELKKRVAEEVGGLDAVVASLGSWWVGPLLVETELSDLQGVLDGNLIAHFLFARTFLPALHEGGGGSYTLINGPSAFLDPRPGMGAVAISTAAQTMLMRALAQEVEYTPVRVNEVVMYAFIGPNGTRPQSPISGEELGRYVAHLASEQAKEVRGKSIYLRSPEQVVGAASLRSQGEA